MAAAVLAGLSVLAAGDAARVARSRVRQLSSTEPGGPVGGGGMSSATTTTACVASGHGRGGPCPAVGRGPALAGSSPGSVPLDAAPPGSSVRGTSRSARRLGAPRFADLVAACLESGAAPADAVDVVRQHLHGPLAGRLAPVVGALRSGVDPLSVYGDHGRDDPVRGLVAALARAMESGAPLADTVAAVADDQRRRRRWSAEAAARRAGVHAVGPLVVCFLPAFVLLGVVPVVLGIAAEVLGDLS